MAVFLFALISLIWGSTWVVIKAGLEGMPPFLGAGLRFALSTVLVGLLLLVRRTPIRLTPEDRICVYSLGFLVFFLDYAAVYWAEQHISSGLTAVLFSTMPLMTTLLTRFWTRTESLSSSKVAGILIGVAGTVMLFWPDDRLATEQVLGMLATLGAAFFASVNLVTMKQHGSRSDSYILNVCGMGIGTVCLLVTSALFEPWTSVVWSPTNVAAILYLAVFGSVIAFSAYYALIKIVDATVVSLSTLVIPIVALVLGRVVLGETVTGLSVAGIVTILAGVAIAMRRR